MELRHIAGFVAVAEELHFGRAAERLQLAQPPLSQQIRQLERELGVQLFERTTRVVRLTSAGQAMLAPAQRVLADVAAAVRTAHAGGRGEFGRVAVGFAGASSHENLPRLTRAVRARHPGIDLVLRRHNYANDALAEVANGSLDLGFVRLPVNREGLEARVIEREELIVALPADHRLARRKRVALTDLAAEPFVALPGLANSPVRDILVHACMASGFSPLVAQEAPDTYTVLALVAAGVGVTLTPSSVQHVRNEGMVFRPLAGHKWTLQLALAWRTGNPSTALRRVLDVATDALPSPEPDGTSRRGGR